MPEQLRRYEIVARLTLEGMSLPAIAQELGTTMQAVRAQKSLARRNGLLSIATRERACNGMRKCRGPCRQLFVEAHYVEGDHLCPECRTITNLRRARAALLRGDPVPTEAPGIDPWPLWRALGLPEVKASPAHGRFVQAEEMTA